MDVHFSDQGASTADKVHEREEFRLLVGDIHELPETQRTALVLREMDALSYEQIAEAMETTVPSVKSLLVRARISLAEAAEARVLSCEQVRIELGELAEGLQRRPNALVRRHLRTCQRCEMFRGQLKETNKALAALLPIGPFILLKKLVLTHLGHSAGSGATAAGSGAAGSTAAAAGTAAGGTFAVGSTAGGFVSAGIGAIATKAAAGLAAAALVTAGAVEVDHSAGAPHHSGSLHAALPVPAPAVPIPAVQPASAHVSHHTFVKENKTAKASRGQERTGAEEGARGGDRGAEDAGEARRHDQAHDTPGPHADADRSDGPRLDRPERGHRHDHSRARCAAADHDDPGLDDDGPDDNRRDDDHGPRDDDHGSHDDHGSDDVDHDHNSHDDDSVNAK